MPGPRSLLSRGCIWPCGSHGSSTGSTERGRRWVLDPGGAGLARCLALGALPALYNILGLACRAAFPEVQKQHKGLWRALDALSDAAYLGESGVCMHTGFLEDGLLVQDLSRVRRRYLLSASFALDAASLLPLDLVVPWVPLGRANRCLRAPHLLRALDLWETRTSRPNLLRAAKLLLYVFAAIHGLACSYFALSSHIGLGADPWVCPNGTSDGFDRPLRQYLHSLYFATLILTTVGDTPEPQREEEFLFLTFGYLLAVLGFATITGSISSVISNIDAADAAFYPDPEPVRHYLRTQGAAPRLERRVASWHHHLRAERKLPAEREVLGHLPPALMAEVVAEVHLPALLRVDLFRGWEQGVLRQLVLRLRPQSFGPGEFVCRRGDVGREMFFIREGRLAVLAEDGITRLALLGQGLYFGEISLIDIKGKRSGSRRTASIISLGHSDLFALAKEDLAQVVAEVPSARAALEAKGRMLLLRAGLLDAEAEAAAAEAERRARGLREALEELRRGAARLLAELESSETRLERRLRGLERRQRRRRRRRRRGEGAAMGGGPGGTGSGGQWGHPKV